MNEIEQRDLHRGNQAQQVMDSEIITEAFNDVRMKIRNSLFASARTDMKLRESCYYMDDAITLVISQLNSYIARAKGVEAKLKMEEES